MNANIFVSNALQAISDTASSITAFFYQKIDQSQYSNNTLQSYQVNYDLLLPGSQFIVFLSQNQVNAQIQSYVELCNTLTYYINKNVDTQTNLYFENIQNILDLSISNLNGFALSLLKGQFGTLFVYTVEVSMSMTSVLYLNRITLDDYPRQVQLNLGLPDFNNIKRGTPVTLSR